MTQRHSRRLVDYWFALNPRERLVLTGGTMLLIALLVVFLFWLPIQEQLAQEKQKLAERVTTLQWMQQASTEVARLQPLRKTSPQKKDDEHKSILSLADQTARNQGLGDALKRVEPEGTTRVRLSFENVSFDGLLDWLAILNQQHDIQVQQLTIEADETPGQVQARLVLGPTGSKPNGSKPNGSR